MSNRVLVTGGSGYLGAWIVKMFLQEGFIVHTTTRDMQNETRIYALRKLQEQYGENLKIFSADLLVPNSFDKAMQGCTFVIHSASPYIFTKVKNPKEMLLRPALEGTKNLLKSVEKTDCIKRVVLTSSIVALFDHAKAIYFEKEGIVSVNDTNKDATLKTNPYAFSKTVAEQFAWQQQKKSQRWSLVTIHPGAIFGPSLSKRTDGTSVSMMRQFLDGSFKSGVPKLWLGVVDVRDVAFAHLQAAIDGHNGARYIVVAKSMRLLEIAQTMQHNKFALKDKLPKREIPKWLLWIFAPFLGMQRRYVANNVGYPIKFDDENTRAHLKLNYYASINTFDDHIEQLLRDRLL